MPTALVDALDLVVARRAAGALPGERRAAGVGAGTELAQLRPYEVGDDVRQIDAAATARTGEPHVRLHVPERTLTTWIVLDVSPSMAFGTARAAEVRRRRGRRARARPPGRAPRRARGADDLRRRAPAPAAAARRRGPASSRCAARSPRASRPTASTSRTRSPTRWAASGGSRASPGFVVVISDFREHDGWTRALGALRRAPLRARRRGRRPARGRAARRRPAGARRPRDGRARRGRHLAPRACASASPRSSASAATRVARELRRLHVDHVALSTDATGCASSGGGCGELRHARSACSALAARAAGAAGLPAPAAGARSRYAVRFTAVPDAEASPRPRVPAWRRHLPAALALAALAALVLALAKPQETVAVPVERASIMLVTDHSRSMRPTDVEPDRLSRGAARGAHVPRPLPDQVRVGVVAFSDTPDAVQAPSADHDDARRIVDAPGRRRRHRDRRRARGRASTRSRTTSRTASARRRRSSCSPTARPPTGRDPVAGRAHGAAQLKIPIYTVALGTRDATVPNPNPFGTPLLVPPDPETLRQIAAGLRRQGLHGRGRPTR